MEISHSSHPHPLMLLNQEAGGKSGVGKCYACWEAIEGVSTYGCVSCEFFLHRKCVDDLPRDVHHPFHPRHPLILDEKLQRRYAYCDFCRKSKGFTYYCDSCNFDLCVQCATHPQFAVENLQKFQHFSHEHALTLYKDIEPVRDCLGCREPLSSPFYCCFDCGVYFHKACVELPRQIDHPSHRKHLLTLLPKPPSHQPPCSCNVCKKTSYKGYVYHCSICKFGFKAKDALVQTIQPQIHEHSFTSLLKPMSFTCDACGIQEDQYFFPYACLECSLVVHKRCASLSKTIKITRHQHRLSHIFYFREEGDPKRDCGICQDEVKMEFGSYCCLDCKYFVHVDCGVDPFYLQDGYQEPKESVHAPKEFKHGDEEKHFSHKHSLIYNEQANEGGKCCDGCMRPISTSFFHCAQCDFFLHQNCFELPMESRHWICKHLKSLKFYTIFRCTYCSFYGSGFGYHCYACSRAMCLRCHEIPDFFTSERHEHPLLYDHKCEVNCVGCGASYKGRMFKCKDIHQFALEYQCLTMPSSVAYKNDEHPLLLCTSPSDHSIQHYCDICEGEIDMNHWFYRCGDCNVSAHRWCALGIGPFVKLGKPFRYGGHKEHLVTFVKIDFNPPKCNDCNKPCRDVALQCTEASCNYIVHWYCPRVSNIH